MVARPQPRCGWIGCGSWTHGRPRASANPWLGDATPLALVKSVWEIPAVGRVPSRGANHGPRLAHQGGASCTAPACNGEATSSSPFQSHSHGDEDIAAPFPFSNGGSVRMRPGGFGELVYGVVL